MVDSTHSQKVAGKLSELQFIRTLVRCRASFGRALGKEEAGGDDGATRGDEQF
jgi:hypothetical protein